LAIHGFPINTTTIREDAEVLLDGMPEKISKRSMYFFFFFFVITNKLIKHNEIIFKLV
jgi:hypothetical protein